MPTRTSLGLAVVVMLSALVVQAASLEVLTPIVAPGGEVRVRFAAPATLPDNAWIGIIPSDVPHGDEAVNDAHDETYEYLDGRTAGILVFEAPARPGSWDARLNDTDDNGREIASATFQVAHPDATGATVEVSPITVFPGEEIRVLFRTPPGFADSAWVGILPSSIPHGSEEVNDQHEVAFHYLEGETEGERTFWAPAEPGSWDVRLHDTDSNGREVASATFTVSGEIGADDIAVRLEEKGSVDLYGIHFATDSDEITTDSAAALAPVGQLLLRDPELELIIVGHTDATGAAGHNLELSRRRAAAVVHHLVGTFGIEARRLESVGRGADEPVATNDTASGRALNRRVELVRR